MANRKSAITQIAERCGKSPEFVRGVIREHPELDIVMESRKATFLTQNQASALVAIIQQRERTPAISTDHDCQKNDPYCQLTANLTDNEALQLKARIEELERELAATKTDLAVQKALADERKEEIGRFQEHSQKLLESAEAKARRAEGAEDEAKAELEKVQKDLETAKEEVAKAQAEAESFKPSWFGFYRKQS